MSCLTEVHTLAIFFCATNGISDFSEAEIAPRVAWMIDAFQYLPVTATILYKICVAFGCLVADCSLSDV